MPVACTLEITLACNLKCLHCFRPARLRRPELTTAEVRNLVDYLVGTGFLELLLEGAEPFCRPDIFDILEYAAPRLGLSLTTNGTLVDREVATRLAALGVVAVFVRLHGPDARSHESVTRVPGSFVSTIRGVEALVAAGVTVVLYTPILRQNVELLRPYMRLARDLGARGVNLVGLYRLGRARKYWDDLCPSLEALRQAVEALEPLPGVTLSHRYYPYIHNCCTQACTVDASGDVVGCLYLRGTCNYGSVRETSLLDLWDSVAWRSARFAKVGGKCACCENFWACGGGCRATALEMTGRWDAPDPLCWKE